MEGEGEVGTASGSSFFRKLLLAGTDENWYKTPESEKAHQWVSLFGLLSGDDAQETIWNHYTRFQPLRNVKIPLVRRLGWTPPHQRPMRTFGRRYWEAAKAHTWA